MARFQELIPLSVDSICETCSAVARVVSSMDSCESHEGGVGGRGVEAASQTDACPCAEGAGLAQTLEGVKRTYMEEKAQLMNVIR